MSLKEEQCKKVCRILDNVLANRPTERDSLILAVRKAFAEPKKAKWIATTALQEGQITWRDYKCSNCSHHRGKPMNYCEVCGAKMER